MNKDKVLGKVAIKREDLHKYNGKDYWFPIINVDADSEVQVIISLDGFDKILFGSNNGSDFKG